MGPDFYLDILLLLVVVVVLVFPHLLLPLLGDGVNPLGDGVDLLDE